MKLLLALMLAGTTTFSPAQNPLRREPSGIVAGHVTCADTQRPARLAQVKLVAAPAADFKPDSKREAFDDAAPAGNAVETDLTGAYTLRGVKPGHYYVVVDKEGYLLPLGNFSGKQLASTDLAERAKVDAAVHTITVRGDDTTVEDVMLQRGANVSGTVSYDDGTPAGGIQVKLLVKGADGKWVAAETSRYRKGYGYLVTDDNGHYRSTGLEPGEYATEADLSLSDHEKTQVPMADGKGDSFVEVEMTRTRFSLPIYSGDVLRKPDVKPYSLGSGEARVGADLVFPLAKLHKVGGQVLAKDGHPVNGGKVTLLYPDDKSEMTEASVQYEDKTFALEFVPQGDFLLKVTGARDQTRVQVENAAGYTPRFREENKTLKSYGDAEQPLTVKGDSSDVIVIVPESKAAAK